MLLGIVCWGHGSVPRWIIHDSKSAEEPSYGSILAVNTKSKELLRTTVLITLFFLNFRQLTNATVEINAVYPFKSVTYCWYR